AAVLERLGNNAENWQARLQKLSAGRLLGRSSPPAVPGCGKSPSVWACTIWRTWAAARRDDPAPKAGFQARLHFTLPETLARFRRSCRKLSMSGSCEESLAIRYEKQARMPPTPKAVRGCRLIDTRKPGRPTCGLRMTCRLVE